MDIPQERKLITEIEGPLSLLTAGVGSTHGGRAPSRRA